MIRAALLLVALSLAATPAAAGLSSAELDRVAVDPPSGARLDLGLGRPAVLVFADVTCGELCDAILAQTAATLDETGLTAGEDYALVVVSLDPEDSEADAAEFVAAQAGGPEKAVLLQPDAAELARMTSALGYGYAYDAEADRFAHPAARFILDRDGTLSQVIPAFRATPDEMRAAIRGAAAPPAGALQRLVLLCYGLDPVTGRYSLAIGRVLTALSLTTAAVVGGAIGIALWRERRRQVR